MCRFIAYRAMEMVGTQPAMVTRSAVFIATHPPTAMVDRTASSAMQRAGCHALHVTVMVKFDASYSSLSLGMLDICESVSFPNDS